MSLEEWSIMLWIEYVLNGHAHERGYITGRTGKQTYVKWPRTYTGNVDRISHIGKVLIYESCTETFRDAPPGKRVPGRDNQSGSIERVQQRSSHALPHTGRTGREAASQCVRHSLPEGNPG